MKKMLTVIAAISLLSFFIGCAPALQIGASLIGEGIGNGVQSGLKARGISMVIDYPIGKYTVKATNYRKGGATLECYDQNKKKVGEKITIEPGSEYSKMTIAERKEFIKKEYLKKGVALEPEISEAPEKSPSSPATPTPPSFPAFAPTIRL